MISPIGNSYSYYTSPYASGSTAGAARTALALDNQGDVSSVSPVDEVPEVFSNEDTERVPRTPAELEQERKEAYELMLSLTPRNAEHVNAPLEFMTKAPFSPDTATGKVKEEAAGDGQTEFPETEECETCENRTYVDGSNEADVSFKTPGHISPEASAARVSAHEYEHVRNALQEDKKEDAELVSVPVSLKTAICPECGRTYVSGGETRTTMRYGKEQSAYEAQQEQFNNFVNGASGRLNLVA